jgi:hypothetical protein
VGEGEQGQAMNLPVCEVCGRSIAVRESIVKEVRGWLRPQGTGGGQIVDREETGRFAHRSCVEYGPPEGRLL